VKTHLWTECPRRQAARSGGLLASGSIYYAALPIRTARRAFRTVVAFSACSGSSPVTAATTAADSHRLPFTEQGLQDEVHYAVFLYLVKELFF